MKIKCSRIGRTNGIQNYALNIKETNSTVDLVLTEEELAQLLDTIVTSVGGWNKDVDIVSGMLHMTCYLKEMNRNIQELHEEIFQLKLAQIPAQPKYPWENPIIYTSNKPDFIPGKVTCDEPGKANINTINTGDNTGNTIAVSKTDINDLISTHTYKNHPDDREEFTNA